jgi:hypothetical protein
MKTKRIKMDLPVPLPADLLQKLSSQIANKVGERDQTEQAKAAAVKEFNQTLAHHDADISEIASAIRANSMQAGIECDVYFDAPAPGFKQIRRLDTGEFVGEPQPMEEADRQEELFEGGAPLDLEKMAQLPDDRITKAEPPAPPTPPGWTQQKDTPEPPPEPGQ